MWKGPVTLVVICGVAVAVVPALAAQTPTITATSSNEFTPSQLTITAGEAVTFANAGGIHNFSFDDGQEYPEDVEPPGEAWDDLKRTFSQPGSYDFICEAHAPMMRGTIEVKAPTPTPTPTPTRTPAPPPQSSTPAPLEIRTLKLAARKFCTKRGPHCKRPGVRVRIDLSQPATVTGALRRRGRRYGRVRFGTVATGARTLAFRRTAAGRRLLRGRYTLRLQIAGELRPALRFNVR